MKFPNDIWVKSAWKKLEQVNLDRRGVDTVADAFVNGKDGVCCNVQFLLRNQLFGEQGWKVPGQKHAVKYTRRCNVHLPHATTL
jgi:hypothetical protein